MRNTMRESIRYTLTREAMLRNDEIIVYKEEKCTIKYLVGLKII